MDPWMRWHCSAAHRWKGAAGGNFFRIDIRREMKCDVPTPRETLHSQHLQAKEFRRQWGQTYGLQATMHIWHSCEQLQNLPRLLSATSMMQNKCGPLWHPRPCIFQQTRKWVWHHLAACHRFAEDQMVPVKVPERYGIEALDTNG